MSSNERVFGAFEPTPLTDCRPTDIDAIIERLASDAPDGQVPLILQLVDEGISPALILAASFHGGLRRLDGDVGGTQHRTMASFVATTLAERPGDESELVAAAWAGAEMADQLVRVGQPQPGLDSARIPTTNARAVLDDALAGDDPERAEEAIVGLVRQTDLATASDALLAWVPRYLGHVGHSAIFAAISLRALRWCPQIDPEPGLRRIAAGLGRPDAVTPGPPQDQADAWFLEIAELATSLDTDGTDGAEDPGAVSALMAAARQSDAPTMHALVADLLRQGVGAGSIFTGTILSAAELVLRCPRKLGTAIHAVDAQHALMHAWALAQDSRARTTLLLAAAQWLPVFRDDALDGGWPDEPWPVELDTLAPTDPSGDLEDVLEHALSDPRDAAARLLGWWAQGGDAARFEAVVRDLTLRKGTFDAHSYKFPFAMLESLHAIDAAWRPYLAAAATVAGPLPGFADWASYHRVDAHAGG